MIYNIDLTEQQMADLVYALSSSLKNKADKVHEELVNGHPATALSMIDTMWNFTQILSQIVDAKIEMEK